MADYIGNVIKALRILKGLTQSQVSENICSIKQLSRIERNESNPTSYLLSLISERLGHELYEYLPYTTEANAFELKNELSLAIDYYHKQHFSKSLDILLNSECLNSTENKLINMEMAWLLGALANYIDVPVKVDENYFIYLLKKQRTFITLDELFGFTLSCLEYKILNSLIVIYLNDKKYKKAELLLLKCIQSYEKYHSKITDTSYVRFIYNLSRLYLILDRYEDAANNSLKGLNHCLKNNSITLFPDLCNLYGRSIYKLDDIDKGKEFIKSYIFFNELLKPSTNYISINKLLSERYNI